MYVWNIPELEIDKRNSYIYSLNIEQLICICKNGLSKEELVLENESFKYHALKLDPKYQLSSAIEVLRLIYVLGLKVCLFKPN